MRKKLKRRVKPKPKPKAILLDRRSLSVLDATDNEDKRFALTAVKLEPDGTTLATNGRLLFAVQPTRDDPDEFPCVGQGSTPAVTPKGGCLLPAVLVKRLQKSMNKKSIRPILDNVLMTRCDEDEVEFASTDLSTPHKESARHPDGSFPSGMEEHFADACGRVFFRVHFGVKQLLTALGIARKASTEGGSSTVEMLFVNEANPRLVLRGKAGPDRMFACVAAAFKADTVEWSNWERDVLGVKHPAMEKPEHYAGLLERAAAVVRERGGSVPREALNMIERLAGELGVYHTKKDGDDDAPE